MITSAMERENAREGRWEEPQEVEASDLKQHGQGKHGQEKYFKRSV